MITVGKYNLPSDAWRQATFVLLRYPENKAELSKCIDDVMTRDPEKSGNSSKPIHSDPTGNAGIKLASHARYQRIRREVKAVEDAVRDYDNATLEVIRERYWKHGRCRRRPRAYECINAGYSERQMHRICQKTLYMVAVNLGEI